MESTLPDIPASSYLKAAIWTARLFRKSQRLRRVVANVRNRFVLGTLSKLHLEAIHAIRTFALNRESIQDNELTYSALEGLANGCSKVFADVLEAQTKDIHCTIKLCGNGQDLPKEEWQVYTIARSVPCERPAEFGIESAHLIGHNSDFATLCGANDRKNTWYPNVFSCFICNDLASHTNYDCSRVNWQSYYQATAVFPLRYRRPAAKLHHVIGFLTFDTLDTSLFSEVPCIFHNRDKKFEYERNLSFSSVYHLGGILADTLACTFYPLIINTQEEQ